MTKKILRMFKRLHNWLKKSPWNVVIAAVIFLLVVVGLVLFFLYVFPVLLFIGFMIAVFGPDEMFMLPTKPEPQKTLEDEEVRTKVAQVTHKSIISVKSALTSDVVIPDTHNDLYDELDCLHDYHGVKMFSLYLSFNSKDAKFDCAFNKKLIQRAINARLRDGYLRGEPWAIKANKNVPLIKIVGVTCSDMCVYIDVLLTNTNESVHAAKLADKPAPRKASIDKKPTDSGDFDKIPFLLDETAYRLELHKWVEIDYKAAPHVLWCGRTGSGKTVAAKLLLARTALLAPPHFQPVEITVIDPKGDTDFDFLNGLPRFYRGEAAPQGLDDAYEAFIRRQNGVDKSRNLKLVFIDEFASLVNLIEDKKQKEAAHRKLSLLLMLSRSFGFSIQTATQQPSAQTLGNSGNREQYGAVCLLSDSGSETLQMLFDGDSREVIKQYGNIGSRGAGWLSLNGGIAQPVRVPKLAASAFSEVNEIIKNNLMGLYG